MRVWPYCVGPITFRSIVSHYNPSIGLYTPGHHVTTKPISGWGYPASLIVVIFADNFAAGSRTCLSSATVGHGGPFPFKATFFGWERGHKHWAVMVSDLVTSQVDKRESDAAGRDKIGGGRDGNLEVWGLTGWYLSLLMRLLEANKSDSE